tara:strand:+ start:156 stop:797 length:642 start_codon:yes stop_codon:yes gene_type:complete
MFKIAHRGFVNQCRENSIQSIKNAIEHGFDMVEIDVQLTKDDIIILYHDIRIEDKLIRTLTYSEIMKIVHVDTLDVVLNTFDTNVTRFYIDMKGCNELATKLSKLLIVNQVHLGNVYLASFNINHLIALSNSYPPFKLGLITDNEYDENILKYICKKVKLHFMCIHSEMLNDKYITLIKKYIKNVFVFTCKNYITQKYITNYNVDGIVSDIIL